MKTPGDPDDRLVGVVNGLTIVIWLLTAVVVMDVLVLCLKILAWRR